MRYAILSVSIGTYVLGTSALSVASENAYRKIQVKAWAGASCLIKSVGTSSDSPVPAWADDLGIVQFGAVPPGAQGAVKSLSLNCHDDAGRTGVYDVDLTSASAFAPLPEPTATASSIRPALGGDPMSYSHADLLAKGYGIRPDPVSNTEAYNVWSQAASKSMRVATTVRRPMPVHAYGTLVSQIPPAWSGGMFEESLSGDYFDVAYSTFTVPSATATTACSAASIWAGLGGWGAADLIQTGVQMIGNSTVVNTYPFIEYWSGNNVGGDCYSSECYLGYNVSAGDSMLAEVWAGDGSCRTADYSGGYGCFYLVDVTNGWTYLGVLSQINQFQGLTAEFIAEDNAPNNACDSNGTYTDFATVKAVFSAVDTTNTTHTWQSDPNGYVRMLSASASNQLLGFAAPLSPNKLNLTWMQGK